MAFLRQRSNNPALIVQLVITQLASYGIIQANHSKLNVGLRLRTNR